MTMNARTALEEEPRKVASIGKPAALLGAGKVTKEVVKGATVRIGGAVTGKT